MRGRRRRSPSSSKPDEVALEQSGMALRKQVINDIVSESQQTDEDTQEDDDADNKEELSLSLLSVSSTREKRRRGRENKPKVMTEDEMMDLALRLSEQEASVSALRRREEEEAVMKAIQESMVDQTSQSESLLCSQRKLSYPNGIRASAASEDACRSKTDLGSDTNCGAADDDSRSKKRRRKAGSPLLETPDVSQKVSSQDSQNHFESLDSPQSSDSTQIDDCELRKSPVFPLTGCRAEVLVSRLNQNLLDSCRNSGFVFCSQDSCSSTQKSARPDSPTFPGSNLTPRPKSPVFSEAGQGDEGETELSPEYVRSPVYGRSTQREASPSACKAHQNSGFTFSSQESLTPSVRASSSRHRSPVFPRSPGLPSDQLKIIPDSPGQTEQNLTPPAADARESPSDSREDTRADGGLNAIRPSQSDKPKQRLSTDWSSSQTELSSDMKLVWSDDDDVTTLSSPSPVFPEEAPVDGAGGQAASLDHQAAASPEPTGLNHSCRRPSTTEQEDSRTSPPSREQTVHYYWGVPFCPRGLDPDRYTQVILAQMEVYEKSLKRAQRSLLRKAEWGEAVLPQAEKCPSPESPSGSPPHHAPRRRGLRLRGKKMFESADSLPAEEEEETNDEEEQEEKKKKNEEDEKTGGDEGQVDADDCVVCPETQLSEDSTQDVIVDADGRTQRLSQSPEEVQMIRDDSPAGDESQEHGEDMEVDGETEGAVNSVSPGEDEVKVDGMGPDVNPDVNPDVEEVKDRGLQRTASPELDPLGPRGPETSVDCPICQTSFPASEIEVHAAYCDGDVDERTPDVSCSHVSLKPWTKRIKRSEVTAPETSDSAKSQEKCYVCQRDVPLRDYSRHTELCIRRQPLKSAAKGTLLSALEQTENRPSEAGPSSSKVQSSDVIDLNDDDDDDDDDDDVSVLKISNSPIRSFTPISEATDCLIDFKKRQRTKKMSRRRR